MYKFKEKLYNPNNMVPKNVINYSPINYHDYYQKILLGFYIRIIIK